MDLVYMIRKIFKKQQNKSGRIHDFIVKHKIPREYLSTNRKSISKGIFIGLFWGFIPMPMQMLAVLAMTPFFRFNVPLAISIVWISNPITMPFMYYLEYLTGNFILGKEGVSNIELTLDWFSANWDMIVVPLYIGTIFYSVIVSSTIYLIINRLWISSLEGEKRSKGLLMRIKKKLKRKK